jgi:WD repeat and SOF domain-containing protein 1
MNCQYVRDCLEVLRVGAGLDSGNRFRRGHLDDWKYIYVEAEHTANYSRSEDTIVSSHQADPKGDADAGLVKMRGVEWELPPIALPSVPQYRPYASLPTPCDPDSPRLFHMFWTGPFTDKPYTALLSFLYTQNTGLHLQVPPDTTLCRSQFWMWITPGPAAAVPNPSATQEMFSQLQANSWAAPFLHPRFKDVIRFKLWNTTEQLDGIPELKDEWRNRDLFNSGGRIHVPPSNRSTNFSTGTPDTPIASHSSDSNSIVHRDGSKSSPKFDRLSVILSDMARFILCHRFGGIYLDADTIFLRDWEELWGWKGAFAYRWSRLKRYNTAVLHLNKGSALGQFIFRTALKNDLDFHPMTISRYTKDAYLEGLLLRLPDALFDSAWLNAENYQRDRPPQPYFTE